MTFPVFNVGDVLTAADMNAAGLWLVKTQTVGAGVSSVNVTGAFSADYANYFVTWTGGTMSNDTAMRMQLGATATAYFGAFIHTPNYTGTTAQSVGDNNNSQFTYVGGGNSSQAQASFYCSGPQLAARTYVWASNVSYGTVFGSYSGRQESTTQFTAFTLSPFAGTMTGGTIRVYGYRN